jgi:hypothetical protein
MAFRIKKLGLVIIIRSNQGGFSKKQFYAFYSLENLIPYYCPLSQVTLICVTDGVTNPSL